MMTMSRHQCDYTTMIGLDCLLVLATVLQVITSQGLQGPPPGLPNNKCAGPPPGVKRPQDCCQAKPLFTEEELSECGFQKIKDEDWKRPPGPPDCSKQECLLQKIKAFENKSIKYDIVKEYLNGWVDSNPEFEPAVATATAACMGEGGPPGPPQICEANRLMFCIGAVIMSECPTWQDTDDCKLLKEHMDQCKARNSPPS